MSGFSRQQYKQFSEHLIRYTLKRWSGWGAGREESEVGGREERSEEDMGFLEWDSFFLWDFGGVWGG